MWPKVTQKYQLKSVTLATLIQWSGHLKHHVRCFQANRFLAGKYDLFCDLSVFCAALWTALLAEKPGKPPEVVACP